VQQGQPAAAGPDLPALVRLLAGDLVAELLDAGRPVSGTGVIGRAQQGVAAVVDCRCSVPLAA
jgi:hypothetical protein